jgi:apolipoprotein N-acyltransferase
VIFTQAAAPNSLHDTRRPGFRLRVALPVALAGGLVLAAAFPPLGIWPLAIAGPALLIVALNGQRLRASLLVGLVFGVALFVPTLSWVINLAWYAWVALALASAAIFGVLAIAQRVLLRLPGLAWPPAVAGWWVAAEALRDRWPWGGFPWGRLSMSQAGTWSAGWAAVGGTPVLTFWVALTGAMLGWLLLRVVSPGSPASAGLAPSGRRALVAPAAATVLAAGITLSGGFFLPAGAPPGPTAQVAAIQGNVPHARTLTELLNDTVVTQNHAAATLKLAGRVAAHRSPAPDLVIWPENSTDLDPGVYPQIYQAISQAVNTIGRPVLVGTVLQDPFRNAGVLWLPGRGPVQDYLKRQLVPFGEYLPLRPLISKVTSLTQLLPENFVAGHSTVIFKVGKIRLGDAICYEIAFDGLVRSDVTSGANLLTVQTNDATYERDGQTGETLQQLQMARIRAVEHDRAVVVASTTGVSAIIAPDGHIVEKSGTWQQAILEARVPLITSRTLADDVGAWPEYVIVLLTVLAFAWCLIKQGKLPQKDR